MANAEKEGMDVWSITTRKTCGRGHHNETKSLNIVDSEFRNVLAQEKTVVPFSSERPKEEEFQRKEPGAQV